jgi:thymidine kinase
MNTIIQNGYLELIIGPMFSGKTSRLVNIYNQYIFCNIPICVINHTIDSRYHDEMLSTHDKIMIPCIRVNKLLDIMNKTELINSQVVIINEGQFFHDLYEIVFNLLEQNKQIYICGLDGDFKRNKFGQILDLIPLCDKVTKLTSLCSQCKNGTPAIFSMRITEEKQQTLVGSANYMPVCRKCYKLSNKINI